MEIGSYEDALGSIIKRHWIIKIFVDLLRKAYDIQKSLEGEDSISCLPTLTLMANCYTKMKEYDVALEYIDNVTSKLINFLNVSSRSIPLLLPNMITNLKAQPIPR